jgi:hypothetical protein
MRIIQAVYGERPETNNQRMIAWQKLAMEKDITYEVKTFPMCDCPTGESNLLRFQIASEIPDIIWADWDTEPIGLPDFAEKGKPYFAMKNGQPQPGLFYVNGCCDYFKKCLDRMKERGYGICIGLASKITRDTDVYEYPKEFYRHFYFTTGTHLR